jgi:phosphoglycolate phosphatase-like HAD superfamily hydrolase
LRHFGLDQLFVMIAGPTGIIQPKPHPSMLSHILKKLEVEPQESLYVGDMTLDAETARAVGTQLALISTGGHTRKELAAEKPDYLLDRFFDLLEIFKSEV